MEKLGMMKNILSHELHQITTPFGYEMWFAYYCFVVFLICGNIELYNFACQQIYYWCK
jgi:hypothetical protein